eukprot:Clim_evm92s25 gene=Clim_evmTU92s25
MSRRFQKLDEDEADIGDLTPISEGAYAIDDDDEYTGTPVSENPDNRAVGNVSTLRNSDEDKKGELLPRESVISAKSENDSRVYQNNPFNGLTTGPPYSIDEAIEMLGNGKAQIRLTLLIGSLWTVDAMEMMVLAFLGPAVRCEWDLEYWQSALLTTIIFVGMALGAVFWSYTSDHMGRRRTLQYATIVMAFMGLLSAFSPSYGWLVLFRFLVGFGIGGLAQGVTLLSEALPSNARGRHITVLSAFWSLGAIFEAALAIALMPEPGWRALIGVSSIPVFIYIFLTWFIPESPRWLVAHGRLQEAEDVMRRLAHENGQTLPQDFKIKPDAEAENARTETVLHKLRTLMSPHLRKTAILLAIIWFVLAATYYGIVLMTSELFTAEAEGATCAVDDHSDLNCNDPEGCADSINTGTCAPLTTSDYVDVFITTAAEFPGILITLVCIDTIGRKNTMGFQLAVCTVFVSILFACLSRSAETAVIFVARAFITGAFQVAFAYTPEVLPQNARALGMGLGNGFSRIGAMITPFIGEVLLRHNPKAAIGTYTAMSAVATICVFSLPYETKGKALGADHKLPGIEMLRRSFSLRDSSSGSEPSASNHSAV